MGLWTDLRVGVRIARADLLDLLRRNDSRRQRVTLVLLGLVALPVWLTFVQQGYALGVESTDGIDVEVVAIARNLLVPAVLVVAVFGGLGAAQSLARDTVQPLVLTAASTRAIVVGKVLYLLATWAFLVILVLIPVVAFAVGAGAPLFLVALVGGVLPLALLTMTLGLALAYLLWLGIERLGLPERARRLVTASLSVVAFFTAFGFGVSLGAGAGSTADLPTGDPLTPLGWYADVLFLGSPMAEQPGVRTAVAVGLVAVLLPTAFGALVRLAPAYWYATSTASRATERRTEFDEPPSAAIGRSGFTADSRLLRIARGYLRGARRRPDEYVHLFYYLFPIAIVVVPVSLGNPGLAVTAVGVSLVLLGVWLAGGVFCLNPLGNEGAMLSQVVLAPTPPRTFVHARLLAGTALGGTVALAGLVVIAAGLGPSVGTLLVAGPLALGALGAVVVTSASFALAIGSVLPKFETTEVFDSIETVAPSLFAALIHGGIALFVLIAAGLAVVALVPAVTVTVGPGPVALAVVALVLVVGALADGSRRYAIARLGQYGYERVALDRPFAVYAAFGLGLLSILLGQVTALTAVVVLGLDLPVELLLPVLFVVEYLGVALVVVGFLYLTRRGLSYLDVGWPSPRELGHVAVGVVGLLVLWVSTSTVIAGLGLPAAEHTLFDTEESDPALLLVLAGLVVLVNGPVEELLYRNVVQKYLTEWFPTAVAILVTSAVFAVVHVPAYLGAELAGLAVTLGLLFGLSCVLGVLYARTQSLFVVAATHGLYNALLLVALYLAS
jgi:membrane protease YdiL (CAAX protease family)